MTKTRAASIALVLATACGARTDLGGARGDSGTNGPCAAPPPASSCTAWQAGEPQTIAIAPAEVGNSVAGAIASGCSVLVAWQTRATPTSISWTTRAVDFTGTLAAPVDHPALTAQSTPPGAVSFATDGSRIGALVNEADKCTFITLDETGHELGDPVDAGTQRCFALASNGSQWSFLRDDGQGNTSLVSLQNGTTTEKKLQFASTQVLWDRVVFPDGSFLLDSFLEQANTQYDNTLTPYDASGNLLGGGSIIGGFEGAPALITRAGNAAMAAWSWSTIEALPVDHLGHAAGPAQMISNATPTYELSIFPVPNGDVLATWIVLEPSNAMSLHARALAPDGTPRGAATLLAPDVGEHVVYGAVDSSGARAVLAFMAKDGTIEALPLTCQ